MKTPTASQLANLLYRSAILAAKLANPFLTPNHGTYKTIAAELAAVRTELASHQVEPLTFGDMTDAGLLILAARLDGQLDALPGRGEPNFDEAAVLALIEQQLAVAAELKTRQAEPFKFTGMTEDGLACYEGIV